MKKVRLPRGEALTDADVTLLNTPAGQREACLVYEMARESKVLRAIFEKEWHREPLLLPRKAPEFLHRLTNDEFKSLRNINGPITSTLQRRAYKKFCWKSFIEKWGPMFDRESAVGSGVQRVNQPQATFNFPSVPFLTIDPIERRSMFPNPLADFFFRVPLSVELPSGPAREKSTISSSTGEYVLLHIGWMEHRNKDLEMAFKSWCDTNRPAHFPEPKRTEQRTKKAAQMREIVKDLHALAACRLLARYPDIKACPPKYEWIWLKNRKEMRLRSLSVEEAFHRCFPFFKGSERPNCFIECRSQGRFEVGARGRAR